MNDNSTDQPINYHDDNRVLRYLLHNVKGLSPVSGGVLGEALEEEYAPADNFSLNDSYTDYDLAG